MTTNLAQQRQALGTRHAPTRQQLLERQEQLKGKSIDPHVASQLMHYVAFDGIGRIEHFTTPDVPHHVLDALESAQTVPLTQVNAPHPREVAKTELDSLVQFMALLRRVPGHAARAFFDEGKSMWLSGNVSPGAAADYFRRAAAGLRDIPGARQLAESLHRDAHLEKTLPQYHENLYGRKFDSEIAHALIENPPPGMLDATRSVAAALIERFEQWFAHMSDFERLDHLDQMHRWVDEDPRPWFSQTPELHRFREDPSVDTLLHALTKVEDGFDVLKVNYLAAQLSMLGRDSATSDWMATADPNYHLAVIPQRSTDNADDLDNDTDHKKNESVTTQGYGIRLHYQPAYEPYPQFERGKSWADEKTPDFAQLTPVEHQAVSTGRPIVTGTSGSTNMMTFMLRHLAQSDPSFDGRSALLGTMAFLVFDGGHSLNEAMAVAESILAHPGQPDAEDGDLDAITARFEMMSEYSLHYERLAELGDRATVGQVLDTALSKTLDYFDAHSHYAHQNDEIAGTLQG